MGIGFGDDELLAEAGWLRNLARALARDEAEADDLCQEALLAALTTSARPSKGLRAWLHGTTRKLALARARREARRQRREQAVAQSEACENSHTVMEATEWFERVLQELRRLPAPLAEVLLLRYLHGLRVEEIARRIKAPAGTVRSRLQRGLEQLRVRMDRRAGGTRDWLPALLSAPLVSPSSSVAGPPPAWKTWTAVKTSTQAALATGIAATCALFFLFLDPPNEAINPSVRPSSEASLPEWNPTTATATFEDLEQAARQAAQVAPKSDVSDGQAPFFHLDSKFADRMGPTGELILTLLDSANGRTVPTGRIRVLGQDSYLDRAFTQSPVQMELAPGNYDLLIQALGFEPLTLSGVVIEADQVMPLGAHIMQRGTSSLLGRVAAASKEELANGFRIELHGAGRQACPDCDQGDGLTICASCGFALDRSELRSDPEGSFQFDGLCSGEYLAVAYQSNGSLVAHQRVKLEQGQQHEIEFLLDFVDLPVRLLDSKGHPFRGVWEEEGQWYTNPVRMLCSDQGTVSGRATWTPPGRISINGEAYLREDSPQVDVHSLQMQLLGVGVQQQGGKYAPTEDARKILLNPKLPSPLPKLRTTPLSIHELPPDTFVLLRVPRQTSRLDISCGPFMTAIHFNLEAWDGEAMKVVMQERCGIRASMLEQAVSCVDCHKMPG